MKEASAGIHHVLREMLAAVPPESRAEWALPETAALYNRRIDAVTDLVQHHFKPCGIKPHKPGTGPRSNAHNRAVVEVGFHSLRHTFVSLCRESNGPLAVVESMVGHASPAMTRHHTHAGEPGASRAVAELSPVMADAGATPASDPKQADAILDEARAIFETMNESDWMARRTVLLSLLATLNPQQNAALPSPVTSAISAFCARKSSKMPVNIG